MLYVKKAKIVRKLSLNIGETRQMGAIILCAMTSSHFQQNYLKQNWNFILGRLINDLTYITTLKFHSIRVSFNSLRLSDFSCVHSNISYKLVILHLNSPPNRHENRLYIYILVGNSCDYFLPECLEIVLCRL